ncbi:MAG TPA: uracil-DNA glycosylase [Chloroflexota bacterium]|nr:uracil-DNA glycosylase [Chloroflexota bacterium]
MQISRQLDCDVSPCVDVVKTAPHTHRMEVDPAAVKVVMISEAPPADPRDDFDAGPAAFFFRTTAQAFRDAGITVTSMQDIADLGVYLTTAIKCPKVGYIVSARTVDACSVLLQKEIEPFPNVKAYLLMGDVALAAMNQIARRVTATRVVPAGSIYKLRRGVYEYRGARVFPSYLQTGKSYLIEKGKAEFIAQDIRAALDLLSCQ